MKKTNISIVGSGNVATHLALAFTAAGHTIRQVLSREYDHAALLASRVGAMPVASPHLLDSLSEVYILAVADDALYDLALDLHLSSAVVVHTSGATPMHVLRNISHKCGVVWSPQTFVRDIAIDYSRLPLCIEGSSDAVADQLSELCHSVSQAVYRLDFEQRRWAHLAAVFVSNFGNAVSAVAQQLMLQHGLDFEMLRPLADETLRKWDFGDLRAAQTGPAVRHDERTLTAQRRLLATTTDPRLMQLYDLLTDIIQNPPSTTDPLQ